MSVELRIPASGESITEVQIGEWLKSEGQQVERDEIVVEIETDKASMELPAPASGVLAKVLKKKGETVGVGEVIAVVEEGAQAGSAPPAARERRPPRKPDEEPPEPEQEEAGRTVEAEQKAQPDRTPHASERVPHGGERLQAPARPPAPPKRPPAEDEQRREPKPGGPESHEDKEEGPPPGIHTDERGTVVKDHPAADAEPEEPSEGPRIEVRPRVMPSARRALSEYGLTAADVKGTGPGGRVLKEDVLRHVERIRARQEAEHAPRRPARVPEAPERPDETVPMSMLRRRIAERLVQAQQTAALLTTFNEVDMTAIMALRRQHQDAFQKRHGVKLGIMSFFVKAVIDALKRIPELNAEVRGKEIVYHRYYDIGVAVGTDKGLVVPLLRDADKAGFAEIEKTIADLAARARDNKLKLEELQGGTFTITNGGVYGSLLSTPIVNPPQSGILGLHTIQDRPVVRDGQIVARPMMYLALTYDHRLVDGREAVTFLKHIRDVIEDPARLLIDV